MNGRISLFSLTLLIVATIGSVRTLPPAAFFGGSLIFFYLAAAVLFLIPIALISAEFSSRFPSEGGVFHWIRRAFGDRTGVLAVWLQWINTMVWYPTTLLFICGTAAHLIDPELAGEKSFLLFGSLAVFWGLTLLNLRGIQISVKLNSYCSVIGTLIPMLLLIGFGAYHFATSEHLSIGFSPSELLPSFSTFDSAGALVTIMASFVGMELAGVYINDIDRPQRNFPKAISYSVAILLATLVLGSLAIAVVIPQDQIRFVDGIMQTFRSFFSAFGMNYLVPVMALMIVIGATGGSVNWLLSPATGLLQSAEKGFLPPFFLVKNKWGVPSRILILQAVVVSGLAFLLQLGPDADSYFWFLMALSTGLYMLMYVLLFLAALKLGRPAGGYQIPKGLRFFSCFGGILSCMATIGIGFQPPPNATVEDPLQYGLAIALGFALMASPVMLLWRYQRKFAC